MENRHHNRTNDGDIREYCPPFGVISFLQNNKIIIKRYQRKKWIVAHFFEKLPRRNSHYYRENYNVNQVSEKVIHIVMLIAISLFYLKIVTINE